MSRLYGSKTSDSQMVDYQTIHDPLSTVFLFLLKKKYFQVLIPDQELFICRNHFQQTNSHECFFGLARLSTHEGKFDQALDLLENAMNSSSDTMYMSWHASISIITSASSRDTEEKSGLGRWFCCGTSRQKSSVLQSIQGLPGSIDKWWMLLELALKGVLATEPPQFYSGKIKEIDKYFGYLSWGWLLMRTGDYPGALSICKELVKVNGARPEAYLLMWRYFYDMQKDFESAEDLASEAVLKLQLPESHNYYVLFCIFYAKTQVKLKRTRGCLDFLLRKFMENPTYPVILFYYGKICAKSDDFFFNGAALGSLFESSRLCDASRFGAIYFWLSKAYMSARQYKEAMDSIVLALRFTESRHLGKISQLNKWKSGLSESIEKIFAIENSLKSATFSKSSYEFCKELCYQIKHLHKHEIDLLKAQMYWKLDKKQRALKKLFGVSGISTVKMSAYFLLMKFLKQLGNFKCLKTVAVEMIEKCKNPQVPSYVWAKANLAYAKALALNSKPGKAILILKCMAKLLPPLPFVNVNFTKFLQRAQSIQDLAQARSDSIETMNAYSFSNYKNSFVMSANNLRDFSQKVISEEIRIPSQNNNKKLARTNTQLFASFRRYKKQQTLEVKENEEAKECTLLGVPIPNPMEFTGFSICSNFKFLYRIAKVALRFGINLQDGVAAVDDYLELLALEKDAVFRETCRNKARIVRQNLLSKN